MENVGIDMLSHVLRNSNTNVVHKIWAVAELIKMGTKAAATIVTNYLTQSDVFHGIQTQAAEVAANNLTLYSTNSAFTFPTPFSACHRIRVAEKKITFFLFCVLCPVFCEVLRAAEHPRAQRGVTLACAKLKDSHVRDALLEYLARDEAHLPYQARARAMEALAYQSNPEDFEVLRQHADAGTGGWMAVLRSVRVVPKFTKLMESMISFFFFWTFTGCPPSYGTTWIRFGVPILGTIRR
jgi:hypothetical protein